MLAVIASVRILVVCPLADQRETLLKWLRLPTYGAVGVDNFHDARIHMESGCPDLLVTALKLGEYNGLHLVVRGKVRNAAMRALILGEPDVVLEEDARREGAIFLKAPFDRSEFQRAVQTTLASLRLTRRSAHKRIAPLRALVGTIDARVHDVSYEGLRLELADTKESLAEHFVVQIPQFNVALPVQRIWVKRSPTPGAAVTWCGVALAIVDDSAAAIWHSVVDSAVRWPPTLTSLV